MPSVASHNNPGGGDAVLLSLDDAAERRTNSFFRNLRPSVAKFRLDTSRPECLGETTEVTVGLEATRMRQCSPTKKRSYLLVRGAVQVVSKLGVSPLVIGLTLVGFGTSMPELVTTVQAVLNDLDGSTVRAERA